MSDINYSADYYKEKLLEIQESNQMTFVNTDVVPDVYFTVDWNTRKITTPPDYVFFATKNEHNADTVYFLADRYYKGVDLTTKTCVVQFITSEKNEGIYAVPGIDILDNDKIVIPWQIEWEATKDVGVIGFALRFYSINPDFGFDYNLTSLTTSSLVLDTLNVRDYFPDKYQPSELEIWLERINNAGNDKIDEITRHTNSCIVKIQNEEVVILDNIDERAFLANKDIDNTVNLAVEKIETAIEENSLYTKSQVDNKFSMLETNIDWKEAVETYDDIATIYPSPVDGWTVNTKDTDVTYRWDGEKWVAISANAIPKATSDLDGLMVSADKRKLDGLPNKEGLNNLVFSTVSNSYNVLEERKADREELNLINVKFTADPVITGININYTDIRNESSFGKAEMLVGESQDSNIVWGGYFENPFGSLDISKLAPISDGNVLDCRIDYTHFQNVEGVYMRLDGFYQTGEKVYVRVDGGSNSTCRIFMTREVVGDNNTISNVIDSILFNTTYELTITADVQNPMIQVKAPWGQRIDDTVITKLIVSKSNPAVEYSKYIELPKPECVEYSKIFNSSDNRLLIRINRIDLICRFLVDYRRQLYTNVTYSLAADDIMLISELDTNNSSITRVSDTECQIILQGIYDGVKFYIPIVNYLLLK